MSESGFYHITFRGVNRQHLFEDDKDYLYFIDSLKNLKAEMVFEVHAYCLMSNHVHLLLREKQLGDISIIMKRLLTSNWNISGRSGKMLTKRTVPCNHLLLPFGWIPRNGGC